MARGVTELDVHGAADAPVAKGELAKLQNLPADLEAALRRSRVTPGPRKTSTKPRAKKNSSKAAN